MGLQIARLMKRSLSRHVSWAKHIFERATKVTCKIASSDRLQDPRKAIYGLKGSITNGLVGKILEHMASIEGFKATTRQTEIQEAQHLDMGIGNKAYSPKFGEKVAHSIHNVKK